MSIARCNSVVASPELCIGLPVYNGENYIAEAIDSVLTQSFRDFELVISDNASTDSTAQICREYAKRDGRIVYIRHDENIGPLANFEFVLRRCVSPYFSWLAHDDLLLAGYLDRILGELRSSDQAVLITSDFEIVDASRKPIGVERLESVRGSIRWEERRLEFFRIPISNAFFCFYGVMRTRSAQDVFSSMWRSDVLSGTIESAFLSRMACRGEIVSVPAILRTYRRHIGSMYYYEITSPAGRVLPSEWRKIRIQIDVGIVFLRSDFDGNDKIRFLVATFNRYIIRFPLLFVRLARRSFGSLKHSR